MKFRDKRQDEIGLDLTPFIDVVFMLLLFFVVSTTLFKGANQLGVQLPEANAQKLNRDKNTLEIGVDGAGNYYINGKALGSAEPRRLKAVLATELKGKKALPILLIGDKAAPHQAVVSALEVAGELGITQIQIVAQTHSKKG